MIPINNIFKYFILQMHFHNNSDNFQRWLSSSFITPKVHSILQISFNFIHKIFLTCRTCSHYLGFSIFLQCIYLFSSVLVKIITVVIFLCVISSKTKPRRILLQLKSQNFTVDLSNLENYFVHLVVKN